MPYYYNETTGVFYNAPSAVDDLNVFTGDAAEEKVYEVTERGLDLQGELSPPLYSMRLLRTRSTYGIPESQSEATILLVDTERKEFFRGAYDPSGEVVEVKEECIYSAPSAVHGPG